MFKKIILYIQKPFIDSAFAWKVRGRKRLVQNLISSKFSIYTRTEDDLHGILTFLPYFYNQQALDKLQYGLDKKNGEKVNIILKKIQLLSQNTVIKFNDFYREDEMKKLQKQLSQLKHFPFPSIYHFLYQTKNKYKINIQQGDILDVGARIGDTSITFAELYKNAQIYGFEPEPKNYDEFQKNIKKYNHKRIIPIKLGVSNFEGKSKINGTGTGAHMRGGEVGTDIYITTIDKFVTYNVLQPKIIKRDIEGEEYNSILGAEKTIKKFKPILFISIYHTGRDFFEIKPLIESRNLGYKFGIEKRGSHPYKETMLICY